MSYMISYTSNTEGITISAIGDTMVEALSKLADEFGEGITLLYEHTHEEARLIAESIELSATPRPEPQEPTDEAAPDTTDGMDVFAPPQDVPDPEPAVAGAGEQDPAPTTGGVEAEPAGDSGERCAICGTSVTADRATASRITAGEVRCSGCTT